MVNQIKICWETIKATVLFTFCHYTMVCTYYRYTTRSMGEVLLPFSPQKDRFFQWLSTLPGYYCIKCMSELSLSHSWCQMCKYGTPIFCLSTIKSAYLMNADFFYKIYASRVAPTNIDFRIKQVFFSTNIPRQWQPFNIHVKWSDLK